MGNVHYITLALPNKEIVSFQDIIRKQLEPDAFLAAKDKNAIYEVKFTIGDVSNNISGSYQSSRNFNDISAEFGTFMETVLQNKAIKDFLENENNQ